MSHPNLITPAGVKRIQDEITFLQRIERPQIVEEVAYAAALGDRSENAEYIYGKKRLRQIDGRVNFLMRCLNRIQIIDPAEQTGDRVLFGATVVLEDEDENERTWRIYGQHEVDVDAGIISNHSPLALALIGKRTGNTVRYRTPGGLREAEILDVRYEPQPTLPEPEWKKDL